MVGTHNEHLIRPMPEDFPEVGPTITLSDACRRWKAGAKVIHRWHRENGSTIAAYDQSRRRPRPTVPVPDDFAELAPTMWAGQLERHYKRSQRTIARWVKESGVKPRLVDRAEQARILWETRRRDQPARRQPQRRTWTYTGPPATPIPPRDFSMLGQAAEHLRRYTPVYRATETGRADPNGDHWRYGNTVLTPEQLVERAQRNGWRMATA